MIGGSAEIDLIAGDVVAYYLSFPVEKGQAPLTGRILGVAAAHDRCPGLLPPRHRSTGQLASMPTMVGFTSAGLYLLFDA